MKTLLLLLLFVIINSICYSQVATVTKVSTTEFSFLHSKTMDQSRIDRYTERMLLECIDLDSIEFVEQSCHIKLKENLNEDKINAAINYCILKFEFNSFTISEL